MYALYEMSTGFALLKVVNPEAGKFKLAAFKAFKDTKEALEATTAILQGSASSSLTKFLKKNFVKKGLSDELAVIDHKLAKSIKDETSIPCIHGSEVNEIMRSIGAQITGLVEEVSEQTNNQAALALAHNVARYKLKFSPDKIDLMIIQAIALMDDLDKELNTYVMRVKEWFGWHFPEMQKIVKDNIAYAKVVRDCRTREGILASSLTDILDEEVAATLKEVAAVSMGSDITEDDINNVTSLATEAVELQDYREQLGEYLRHRMQAIAPNFTVMVGELVGARLISKAGSLLQLAKHPASTVQLLGAEKALFKALKNREPTPKYGILFQTSLLGQAQKEHKGKMARVLAAKTALAARIDSFTEDTTASSDIGQAFRERVEARLATLDGSVGFGMKKKTKSDKTGSAGYDRQAAQTSAAEAVEAEPLTFVEDKKEKKEKKEKKRKAEAIEEDAEPAPKKEKKAKKAKKE
ncbi:Nucleolar protein 58 [Diplonema papillatum]|nr:Nucleolar protein 58 [Diplonema papillatum]